MPLTLPPLSRRAFLSSSLAAGTALVVGPALGKERPARDPHTIALLADTHIAADPKRMAGGSNLADNLRQCVEEILALRPLPMAVMINGDLALRDGQPGDYVTLVKLLAPLRAAGLPVHMTLGNHDARDVFYKGVPDVQAKDSPVQDKHVLMVPTPRANWFLLDSLKETMLITGELGTRQIEWLAAQLDAHADRPAIVFTHHNPTWKVVEGQTPSGLADAVALFDMLAERKHVKAYINGHVHGWHLERRHDIHVVHLPAIGYVGPTSTQPTAWTLAKLDDDALELSISATDKKHKLHDHQERLQWRTG